MARPTTRVAIGLPVYNGENYLEAALGSVLAQTFTDFQVIISDNASTDRTGDICRKYAEIDDRIRYIRQPENLGAAPNYNEAFAVSDTEFFTWQAHDDILYPEFLERTVEALDRNPEAVIAFTRCADIDPDGKMIAVEPSRPELEAPQAHIRLRSAIFAGHNTYPIFGLMRSGAIRSTRLHGGYTGSDRVLLAELALAGPLVQIDEPLFGYRMHPEQSIRISETTPKRRFFSHPREAWFDVTRAGRIVFPSWRRFGGYISAVHRANLPLGDRMRCYGEVARWLVDKNWKPLITDLITASYQLFGKLRARRATA